MKSFRDFIRLRHDSCTATIHHTPFFINKKNFPLINIYFLILQRVTDSLEIFIPGKKMQLQIDALNMRIAAMERELKDLRALDGKVTQVCVLGVCV